ncbi:DUF3014 domain-containing protein [Dyella sp.]|jgi:hypothetical protein|uniref:DUF3014 domain-containing protein n=1 Tax=Dyella sp. TaxID=1869338 RepID=UPI002D7A1494|nr:DUF3014 domain-containing protein [Dyella sp.]HET6431324.1 DUF3014 domain-containing protein [Dyella sp.]
MSKRSSGTGWIIAGVAVVAVAVAGYFLVQRARQSPVPAETSAAVASSSGTADRAPAIAHPIDQAQASPAPASTAALPALADSDADVTRSLAALGGAGAGELLVGESIIPRFVATIDALPREGLSHFILPLHPAKGVLQLQDVEGAQQISESNAARYAAYVQALSAVNAQALVDWYVKHYPLFQQAYAELGYPKGYFNDRLITVIDHLLAAPEPAQPPRVVPYKNGYAYADPALQALSVGQKSMIRIGAANEAAVKSKLREVRARLVGSELRAAPAATAAPEH